MPNPIVLNDILQQMSDYIGNYTTGTVDLGNKIRGANRAIEYVQRRLSLPSDKTIFKFNFSQDQVFYDLPADFNEPLSLLYQLQQNNLNSQRWDWRPDDELLPILGQMLGNYWSHTSINGKWQLMMLGPNLYHGSIIATFDNPAQFTGLNQAINLRADTNVKKEGSASLAFDIEPTTGGGGGGTSEQVVASYSETNQDGSVALSGQSSYASWAVAQTFTPTVNAVLTRATFNMTSAGTTSGMLALAVLYTSSGGQPTGGGLAISNPVALSDMSSSTFGLIDFTFSAGNQFNLVAGTTYCIAVQYTQSNTIANINVGIDSSAPTDPGQASTSKNNVTWTTQAYDVIFYVRGLVSLSPTTPPPPIGSIYFTGNWDVTVQHLNNAFYKTYAYLPNLALSAIRLTFGSSPVDYYTFTTSIQDDGTPLAIGWNLVSWNWLSPPTQVGSPNDKQINFIRVDFMGNNGFGTSTITDFRIDKMYFTNPDAMELIYLTKYKGTDVTGTTKKIFLTSSNDIPSFGSFVPDLLNPIALRGAYLISSQLRADEGFMQMYKNDCEEVLKLWSRSYPRRRTVNMGRTVIERP